MVTGKTIYREWFRKWYRVWKWILIQDGSLKQISSLIATPLTILIQDGSLKQISSLTPNHIYCNTIDQEQDDSGDEFWFRHGIWRPSLFIWLNQLDSFHDYWKVGIFITLFILPTCPPGLPYVLHRVTRPLKKITQQLKLIYDLLSSRIQMYKQI